MKEDLLKFRKCCEVLKSEKGFTNEKLCRDMGISDPTLAKLMTIDLSDLKGLRASTLGIIQDFMKRHCNDMNYAGIKPAPEAAQEMKNNLSNYKEPEKKTEPINKPEEELKPILEQISNPLDLFLEALKSIPSNVTIHISINEKTL